MTPLEQCRVHVLDALQNLKEAHAALCAEDPTTAAVKLDLGQVNLTAARRLILSSQLSTLNSS